MIYKVYSDINNKHTSLVSAHKTLTEAGKSYQSAHTGNCRRVVDEKGNDVTHAACDAANGINKQ